MSVIYSPKGKAREYSELACNLYSGCSHKCKYCYCPSIRRMSLEKWSLNPKPRENIIKKLANEAGKLYGLDKDILFCFMSDPYQSEESAMITNKALTICQKNHFKKVQVLTKGGMRAVGDLELFKNNEQWKFGSTIIFKDEKLREYWEPGAPSIESRYEAVKIFKKNNIFTWISMEPVIDPDQALAVINDLLPYVDLWKIGKINYFRKIEDKIDWCKFLKDVRKILKGKNYYIKKDLLRYENGYI